MAISLGITGETMERLIQAAREFHAKEDVVFPDTGSEGSDNDWAMQILADHASDLTLQELEGTLRDLGPDQQAELQALSTLGRGDYTAEDWESALQDAQDDWSPDTVNWLLTNPLIADEWAAGLEQIEREA
ncbi:MULTISPECIES: DUF3775 domain-containing protein [unclassified Thioalkalivibrio]|uniref:DUF3775 domain-containing protein n=1 Tax=unclassified Thioalkalivibrio TaxID=2621013 RepID=UPI00036CF731|nr:MULTISPECIES: DUF3775 domain-containing protein [unclassified Thioalkalivibrio]